MRLPNLLIAAAIAVTTPSAVAEGDAPVKAELTLPLPVEKLVQKLRPFGNIQLEYTIEEQDGKGVWQLAERHKVINDLDGGRLRDEAMVNERGKALTYRILNYDGKKMYSMDRSAAFNKDLLFGDSFTDDGTGTVSAMKPGRVEPYLEAFTGAYSEGRLSQQLADLTLPRTIFEAGDDARKLMGIHLNGEQRIIIDPNTGELVEKASEVLNQNGGREDFTNLKVTESRLIDGRQVPTVFIIAANGGAIQKRFRVDPASIKINSPIEQDGFNFAFPIGCMVLNHIHKTTYKVTGMDDIDDSKKLIDALDKLIKEAK